MMKFFRYGLILAATSLSIGLAGIYFWLSLSLPELAGEMIWPALKEPVNVTIDEYGIPVIKAANRLDAVRVLGYLTARDRLFQMELMRRKNAGRLAEIFGEPALPLDIRARTLGFDRVARKIVRTLPPDRRSYLQAYTQGINRFLGDNKTLPFEFRALDLHPEPWRNEDCLLVALGMLDLLSSNAEQEERMLSIMAKTLPKDVVDFLTPLTDRYTEALEAPQSVAELNSKIPVASLAQLLAESGVGWDQQTSNDGVFVGESVPGSNAWAVSARKTVDGRAILANDMHLGLSVPTLWYRAQIEFPGSQVAGVTLPGFPVMVAGSNRYVSWGETNLAGDFLDLVQLEINTKNQNQYRYLGGWREFDLIDENIRIKDSKTLYLQVRDSLWGPVSQEPLLGRPVAVRWTALDAESFTMDWIDMATATTIDEAIKIAHRSSGPQLNLLMVDDRGHIAWTISGLIPERKHYDGSVSHSWADGSIGWTGYVTPERMPIEQDPESGFLVSANHRRFGQELPFIIGRQFASGYRAYRISEQLGRMQRVSETDMLALQLDSGSSFYDYYQHLALSALKPELLNKSPELIRIKVYIEAWQGRADTNSRGLPLLIEFRRQLARSVFKPFIKRCFEADRQFNYSWTFIDKPLQALLTTKPIILLPDSKRYRNWDDFILGQLLDSVRRLEERYPGVELTSLTWGRVNQSHFNHPFSKQFPWLSWLLDMPVGELPGCVECIRVATPEFGASERLVVSPNHWSDAILQMPGGQSGQPLSPHYRDQFDDWLNGLASSPFAAGKPVTKLVFKPAPTRTE